jgi:hypothetical protein
MTLNSSNSRQALPIQLIDRLESANTFYSEEYENLMKSTGNRVVYLYSDEMILVVVLNSVMFFNFGYFPSEPILLNPQSSGDMQIFLDASLDTLKTKFNLDWISPNLATSLFMVAPSKCVKIPFGSHVVDLSLSEEELWSGVHGKHRNSIRRAEKTGVKIVHGGVEYLEDYLALDHETWARSGKGGATRSMLQNYVAQLDSKVHIFMSYMDDLAQSGAIFMYNCDCCYYIYGASRSRPEPGSANLLHWEAMKYMKNNGVHRYSFVGARINEDEGSKYHGIQRFKERFGGELIQGFMFKSVFKSWKYRLYCGMLFLKNNKGRRYPVDPIEQEKHKWVELNENN